MSWGIVLTVILHFDNGARIMGTQVFPDMVECQYAAAKVAVKYPDADLSCDLRMLPYGYGS